MIAWTGQAYLLADAIREPGARAAELTASAWRAGVIPQATHGLAGTVAALDEDALTTLWAPADPCPDGQAMLAAAEELAGAVTEFRSQASRLAGACREAHDAACEAALAVKAQFAAAQAGDDQAAAGPELASARAEIADCEAASEVLRSILTRLEYALKCLRGVPEDFAAAYEVPLQYIRDGGDLPFSGGFLTGVTTGAA